MPRRIGSGRTRAKHFIREWRVHRNLTQEQLADRIHMSNTNLSRIERGETDYTQGLLEAIAEALGTQPASLLMRNPAEPDAIWSIWDQAKEGQKRQIVEIAKTILRTGTDS